MNETKLFEIIPIDFLFTRKLQSNCLCLFVFDLAQSKHLSETGQNILKAVLPFSSLKCIVIFASYDSSNTAVS